MSGVDPNGGGALVIPSGGAPLSDATPAALGTAAAGVATSASRADHVHEAPASGGTHGAGTLAARPAVPAAGDTYAVTSGAQTGARFTCFVAGTWEPTTMPLLVGHSYDRLAAATAGGGARFLDQASLQAYTSSGDATVGWGVELPGGLGPDRAGLVTNAGLITATVDLSALVADGFMLAALYTVSSVAAEGYVVGTQSGAITSGIFVVSRTTDVVAISNGTVVALPGITPTVGLHSICVAPVFHSGSYWWRYSYDGGTTAEVAMGTTYAAPTTTAGFGAFCRADTAALRGQGHDLAIWLGTPPTVASGLMATIATLPGTPTYRLPVSATTGVPAIRVEANRYDPTFPLVLPASGLSQPLAVDAAVRKVAL